MKGKILQSQGSTLVLIDYSIDETENTVTAMMSYFESGLAEITEVTDLSTGESYNLRYFTKPRFKIRHFC